MACKCNVPKESTVPNNRGNCVVCGRVIPAEWFSANIVYLLGQVRECFPGKPPAWWQEFVRECQAREFRGRDLFGFSFMGKDNCLEGMEEATDAANYAMFEIIKDRAKGAHQDEALALTAVMKAFELYAVLAQLRGKRHGAP